MSTELQACPHCGAARPVVRDAFCSECRNPLEVVPVRGGKMLQLVQDVSAAISDITILSFLSYHNVTGYVILVAGFVPALGICHLLGDDRNGMVMVIGGPLALLIDLVYRVRFPSGHLLLPDRGGKLLYVPVWMLAIVWCLYGLWQLMS